METSPLGLNYPDETDTVTSYPAVAQQVALWVDARPGVARLATADRNALAAPDLWTGKAIYNLTTKTFQVYDPTNGDWSDIPSTNSSVITRSMLVSPTTGKLIGELVVRPGGISGAETTYLVPADGSFILSATWPLLDAHFAAVGYPYGRNAGAGTFGVPDCRDRVVIGAAAVAPDGTRSARPEASVGGEEAHVLVTAEAAPHTHTQVAHSHASANHAHTSANHGHSITFSHNNVVQDTSGQTAQVAGGGFEIIGISVSGDAAIGATTPGNTGSTVPGNTGATTAVDNATAAAAGHNNMPPFIAIPCFIVAA